nr:histone lysine N methyltransferase H3 lysine 36 [Hymenolepis microstoma]
MICVSPDGDGYAKALKSCNKFHVQFFGPDLERAWITENNLIPYQPKSVFQGILAKRRKDNPSQSAKYELKIANHFKKRWEEACKDADIAFVYEKAERIRKFSRFAIPKESLQEAAGSEITLNDVEGLPLTLEEEHESLNFFLSEEMSLRLKSQPDIDKIQLDSELRDQWNNLNISSKRSFLNKPSPVVSEAMSRKWSRKSQLSRPPSPKESPKAKFKRAVKNDTPKVEIDRLTTSPGAFVVSPACDNHRHYSSEVEYEESELIQCTGLCKRYFHPGCVTGDIGSSNDLEDPSKFKCLSCRAKHVLCRVCFKPVDDEEKEKCQMKDCGKHFHYKCISSISGVIIKNDCIQRCPSHVCVSCFLEDQGVSTAPYNELIHCKRCCRAYHPNDLCVPAGSEEINLSFIMCPIHMDPGRKTIYPTGFCLICKGAKPPRFNCSTCPRSFHPLCLGLENAPATYECDDCRSDDLPRYAQIVWMKSTACRWWPCELIHPRNAPMNLSQLKHAPSEFLVHYIGSTDYGWVSRSQTIPYRSGVNSPLNNPIGSASVNRDKMFNRGIRLAKVFYDVYVSILLRRGLPVKSVKESPLNDEELAEQITSECAAVLGILDQSEAEAKALKQAKEKFESIHENIIGSEQLNLMQRPLPDTLCDCASKDRRCTEDSECRNVLESIECDPKVCSVMAEDASCDCGNKKFSKGPAKVQIFLTTNKGVGLKVLEDVHEGNFVIEYIGEVIDAAGEANRRLSKAVAECSREGSKAISTDLLRGTYLLQFTPDLVIDAERFGNYARFINHSCEPNAKPKVVNVDGTLRLCIVALRKLKANEEVTIDYCASNLLDAYFLLPTTVCVCDKPKCSVSLEMSRQFYSSKYISNDTVPMVEDEDDACSSVTTEAASTKEKDQELMGPPAVPSRRADSQAGSVSSTTSRRSVRQSLKSDATSNENQPPPAQAKFTFKKPDMEQKISAVKSRRTGQIKHDIDCYRCQDGGELIMCGKIDCPRVYHIGCLGLAKAPTAALWFCPWHFCDICGKWASYQCYLCTNSYCKDHVVMENGREMIRVRDVDRENYNYMMRLLNTPEFENSPVREELMMANAMRVLWICHVHFATNDGREEDIKPERNEEKMDLEPPEGVSTEVAADPVLPPTIEYSAPVVAENKMQGSAEVKMDAL